MAAGLGFKTFNTGDVLSAADVNGYLMQNVWVFANSAARTSAVTSPQEGNVSFLKDTNSLEIYDGAAWVAYGAGDITGVTAGTGISGGGTSGAVTITNSMATAIDAKGDLIVGTGADTFDRLAVGGTNGHVLTVDSSTSTGLKWAAAAAGGGKVAQVVSTTTSTGTNVSGTTFTDLTNYSVTITPTANTSKILVLGSFSQKSIGPNDSDSCFRVLRGATEVYSVGSATYGYFATNTNNIGSGATQGFVYLDSPATTSATTYKVQARGGQAGTTAYCNSGSGSGVTSQATITVLEILA